MRKVLLGGLCGIIVNYASINAEESKVKIQQGYAPDIQISWENAITQIQEHASKNPFEDSWLYFPEKKLLVDVGEYSRIYKHENKTKLVSNRNDERTKEYLAKKLGPAIAIHVHPDTHLRLNHPQALPYREVDLNYKEKISSPTSTFLREIYGAAKKAKPGIADLRTMFNHSRFDPELVSFCVVTTKGISFYKPKKLFDSKINNEDVYPLLAENSVKKKEDGFIVISNKMRIDYNAEVLHVPDYLKTHLK